VRRDLALGEVSDDLPERFVLTGQLEHHGQTLLDVNVNVRKS
jgi:hypothetical protein